MFKQTLFIIVLLMAVTVANSQNSVGISDISTHTPDNSAVLDVHSLTKGFLPPRMQSTNRNAISNPAAGLIVFDSTSMSYFYYDGTAWQEFLFERYWDRNATTQKTWLSNINDSLGIGNTNPIYRVHITDNNMVDDRVPAYIEQSGTGDAAVAFVLSALMSGYTIGYDQTQGTFKICSGDVLTGNQYFDLNTKFTVHPNGITDINHQSRTRAWLQGTYIAPVGFGQLIPTGTWTAINFDMVDFDEQGEFNPGTGSFMVSQEGYYQINAHTEFIYDPPLSGSSTHMAIAIYKNGVPASMGNKLNVVDDNQDISVDNNGPHVSDIQHCFQGDVISIWVFQNFSPSGVSRAGTEYTYFSIHKIS